MKKDMFKRVNEKLCRSCKFRAANGAFDIFNHCDYALIVGKCRLDPPGTCSHYIKDENYDAVMEEKKREERRKAMSLRQKAKPKSGRPSGRPKKEWD